MKSKTRYFGVITLCIFSISMSIFSYIREAKYGGGEFYPFFYWKLYTAPSGWQYKAKDYRLYGVVGMDTVRISNEGFKLFNKDDYYYFVSGEVGSILNKEYSLSFYRNRMTDFANSLGLNYDSYLWVEEEFNPLEIIKNPNNYTTNIIFSSKND